jgi:uncharacterized protein YfaS (alpha-2-macroglobulin family)
MLAVLVVSLPLGAAMVQPDDRNELSRLLRLNNEGNFAEAYDGLRRLVLRADAASEVLPQALEMAVQCLQNLNRADEIDEFREAAIAAHPQDWRLLAAVGKSYIEVMHFGYMIGGEFHRGPHRGQGRVVHAMQRDRVRGLQLLYQAMQAAEGVADKNEPAEMLKEFARNLTFAQEGLQAWRMQSLTDLEELPDYEEGWGYWGGLPQGAPVDAEGNPVYYSVPASWAAAKNDGERWRWVLNQMVAWRPEKRIDELIIRAEFARSQFGVETMAQSGVWLPLPEPVPQARDGGTQGAAGVDQTEGAGTDRPATWALDTLGDNETIARLATGIRRFELPDDHNHIKLYERAKAIQETAGNKPQILTAIRELASIFENRRQYPRAAEFWREAVERESNGDMRREAQRRLDQIVKNWGQFENVAMQPAGQGATVEFRFRNATHVEFTAKEINVRKLLDDLKTYLKSSPPQLDWQQINISDIGYRLLEEGQDKYIGAEVAKWELALEPRAKHFDKRISVATPLQKPGAYWVTANVREGNSPKIVLWLADTSIVRKPLADRSLYYVADAVTGRPVARANVEFFGYRQQQVGRGNRFQVSVSNSAENTDTDGLAYLPVPQDRQNPFQWVVIATNPEGRLAYLGFHNVWRGRYQEAQYREVKTFAITDRPVYRPGQTVEFKFWIRRAQYDMADQERADFAHQAFAVEIHNPKGEKVYSETLTADAYGGLAGKFALPEAATLGQYQLVVVNRGGGSFRVEEYKKPEFEVTVDAPSEPVMLGEKITATIKAKYYFGSDVTEATVKYKVLRKEHTSRWFPPGPWDWLYGPGYGWCSYEYDWYPGWGKWGCLPPRPIWWWRPTAPPEIVIEREVLIGPDGTVKVEIDTSLAKAVHPNQDHRYEIQAEVVDKSRRTIVGTGQVIVARRPFEVYAWVDRGYYRVGDTVKASFAARRADGKPVQGAGKLRLLKITYGPDPERTPVETEVNSWDLPADAQGRAEVQIRASEQGQYRLSYVVTDAAEHQVEGGYVFTIIGAGFDGGESRFNDLELIPDKREYAPGDKVQLQVNVNRAGATVLLFVRPSNGVYLAPQIVRLEGKSKVVDLDVVARDMPNFYVEAVTIAGGKVHTEVREIYVPPAKRVLNVDVVPSAAAYQPGQKATVKLKLTDTAGEPFVGSTVLSIFDKSVEYISGGSNVGDIKEFFWKWRREHRPHLETNLARMFSNLVPRGQEPMGDLGIFGRTVADDGSGWDNLSQVERGEGREFADGAVRRQGAAPAAMPLAEGAAADMAAKSANGMGGQPSADPLVQPTIRSEFADTAKWVAALETGRDGLAEVELDMPENLTAWKIRVWGMGQGTRVGEATAEVVTRKNVIVRMQAPRFFVERDEVVLSANVHNYLTDAKQVRVALQQTGDLLTLPANVEQFVEIPAGGEARVDWRVKVDKEGEAAIQMLALTDAESDAVQMKFPVFVHGMLKMDSYSGALRPDDRLGKFEITVPAERRAEQTRLEVRYSPTLAGAMVDALPYLVDYPYGCTEQTVNRFLPAVITQKTLLRMGLDLKAIRDKRANLNAQEIGDAAARAKQWQRYDRNPVFDEAELNKIVKANVNRLTEMQLTDGGWGWFSGFGERSTPHTTAVVVHGLQMAVANDVALVPGMLERGIEWLRRYQDEQVRLLENANDAGEAIDRRRPHKQFADNIDALVYMVLVDAEVKSDKMRDFLYRDRTKLAVYSLATYGLALHKQNEGDKLAMVMRNIGQFLQQDDENQTAWLNLPQNIWWYWYGSEYEAHAYYLKLLAATEPNSPVASRLVKYLINNRKHATFWNSTRDTALVVEAMADYLKATNEMKPDMKVEVWVDGQKREEVAINVDTLFAFKDSFVLAGDALDPGRHTVELRKTGAGPLYWNGYLSNFTLEDDITSAGLEIKVERRYYKLTPADKSIEVAGGRGQVVDQRVEKYDREEIPNLGVVQSGDLIQVELVIESKNDYEYVMFEDLKAAGCEPVDFQSGYTGNEMGAYVEFRDDRVSLFVHRLARGRHSVSYRVRAEIPGRFSALPTIAQAMYAPELRGNSDELKLRIEDRPSSED